MDRGSILKDKQNLSKKIIDYAETLHESFDYAELEEEFGKKLARKITSMQKKIGKYKSKYGEDEWITTYESEVELITDPRSYKLVKYFISQESRLYF